MVVQSVGKFRNEQKHNGVVPCAESHRPFLAALGEISEIWVAERSPEDDKQDVRDPVATASKSDGQSPRREIEGGG